MEKSNFLIYGSYGYTGQLITELAYQEGLKPILGGRNKAKLIAQSNQYNFEYRVFDVNDMQSLKEALSDVVCVLHCAGPFVNTYKNMVSACIESATHYLDITGEVAVIEKLMRMDAKAQAAKIMILPGVGFDVVPSDCLAQHLKSRLPDAQSLTLAISAISSQSTSGLSISRGTAKTMAYGMAYGTWIRDEGNLKNIPSGKKKRTFNFGNYKKRNCTAITWGDLASAWWSTKIPHIETYMAMPDKIAFLYKLINPIKFIFKWKPIQKLIENKINALPEGPTKAVRENSYSLVLGEATNGKGKQVVSLLKTPEGYDLTAFAALNIVRKVLAGNAPYGFQTPSTAYGKDLVLEIPKVSREDLC